MVGACALSNGALPVNLQATHLKILCLNSNDECAWADIAIVGSQRTVTPEIAEQLLKWYPSLALHACKSGGGTAKSKSTGNAKSKDTCKVKSKAKEPCVNELNNKVSDKKEERSTFGSHIVGALLPHAAEHLAIEIMINSHPGESFAGNTCWLVREEQHMRVRISLGQTGTSSEACDALSQAIELLNGLVSPIPKTNQL